MDINPREQILKIKQRMRVFTIIVVSLLVINAAVWLFTFFTHYENDPVLLIVGLSCVGFLVLIIMVGAYIERRIKRNLKEFVDSFAGTVTSEDQARAAELLKKWKKHFISSSLKESYKAFVGVEKYPFGNNIVEDLSTVKKGIKVEMRIFYSFMCKENYGIEVNQLIGEICELIKNNSYVIDNTL